MAKKNSQSQPSDPTQQAEAPRNKQDAVRRALAHLGRDAKPTQMQGWIQDSFGITMTTDHISTAKGIILRKKGKKRGRKKASPPQADTGQAAAKESAARPKAPPAGIPLDDILLVKELVGRCGAGPLHTLIDAFAR